MYKEKIINVETGEEIWRDYTFEEIAEIEKAQAKSAARTIEQSQKYIARKVILTKLGITEEEAQLLLGGTN